MLAKMDFIRNITGIGKQFEFVADETGLHQIGGEAPHDFLFPKNDFLGGMPYLGCIDNSDKHFSWLPFKLHLLCPIFTDFDYLFLDYNNPLAPSIIYPQNTTEITSAFDELSKDSRIIYNEERFSLREFKGITKENEFEVVAIAGKPNWEQDAVHPKCPVSKRKMSFVCQLTSDSNITTKEKNFESDNDYYEHLFNQLNFWCDGSLKVFFEPKSKVACFFIQNT